MWARNDSPIELNYPEAIIYCMNFRAGGYSDWRLPTEDEIMKLFSDKHLGMSDESLKAVTMHRRIWLKSRYKNLKPYYSYPCFPIKTGYIIKIHENSRFNLHALPVRTIKKEKTIKKMDKVTTDSCALS
jgi:hypothetical protein